MLGILVMGLVVGAAIGGYAVSQRQQLKRLAKRARRMSDDIAALNGAETREPVAVRSRRGKSTSEVGSN